MTAPRARLLIAPALPQFTDLRVWLLETTMCPAAERSARSCLSEDERTRASGFRVPADRMAFVATRSTLRALLGETLGRPAAALAFEYGEHGKPRLADAGSTAAFSVSHSGGFALIAVSMRGAVGVDVEAVRDNVSHDTIAARWFSREEKRWLASRPAANRIDDFFRLWVAKEALAKCVGENLLPLDQYRIGCRGNAVTSARWQADARRTFHPAEVPVGPGFAAALVVEASHPAVRSRSARR